MIEEAYVSFEVAKLLKEKGFDKFNTYGWDEELFDKEHPRNFSLGFDSKEHWISAPTHQMAMAWLREVHHIFIEISTSIDLNGKYHFSYTILDKECKYVKLGCTNFNWKYEDAVKAALEYVLTNLI